MPDHILQKVRLSKLKMEDDSVDFSHVEGATVGMEFWIFPNSHEVSSFKSRVSGETFKLLTVISEAGNRIPVEMLEYMTEFRVKV